MPEPLLIDAVGVGSILDVCARTVTNMESRGELPRSRKLGRLRKWSRIEILRWIELGQPPLAEWEPIWEELRQQND